MCSIGKRLKAERERLNLNQTAFGEVGGVKKQAQLNYENDTRKPDVDYLAAIASIGVDVLFVITGERFENIAQTPIELSYLRICRALPDLAAQKAGNAALIGVLSSYGIKLVDLPENEPAEVKYPSYSAWVEEKELPMAAERKPKKPGL